MADGNVRPGACAQFRRLFLGGTFYAFWIYALTYASHLAVGEKRFLQASEEGKPSTAVLVALYMLKQNRFIKCQDGSRLMILRFPTFIVLSAFVRFLPDE